MNINRDITDVKVAVVLSTFNGSNFLSEQLNSLNEQSIFFDLFIRDDGSSDDTAELINNFKQVFKKGKLVFFQEKNIGIIQSFSSLLNLVRKEQKYTYVAFCDQDDIWLPLKLEEALKKIASFESIYGKNIPILYHSDLILVNSVGESLGQTFWQKMNLDPFNGNKINKIICQPIVTGCTTVINRVILDTLTFFPPEAKMHDWWASLYAQTVGRIISDNRSYILYRQHGNNAIGASGFTYLRLKEKLLNITKYKIEWKKENYSRIIQAKAFLSTYKDILSQSQISILENYVNTVELGFVERKIVQFRNGFFQHGFLRFLISFLFF